MCLLSVHGGGQQNAARAGFSHGYCLGKLVTFPFQYLTSAAHSSSPVTMQRHQAFTMEALCEGQQKKKEGQRQTLGEKTGENWKCNAACKKKPTKRSKNYRKFKT